MSIFNSTVVQLLNAFGKDVTVTHVTEGTYNPATGGMTSRSESEETVLGYTYINTQNVFGTSTIGQSLMVILSPDILTAPVTGSKVDGRFITSVREIQDKGQVVCYMCELGE